MLKQLRKKQTMKTLLWVLAVLIIPPFVFWGAGSVLRSRQGGPTYAGTIFGKKVSFEEYADAFRATKNQALMIYGTQLNDIYESLNLERQAWERLILLKEAKKKRIKASDDEVINIIQKFPFFQSKGKFDKKAYDLILRQIFGIEARQFEEDMRGFLSISKLRDSVIKDIKITDEEVEEEYKKENEKSKIAYILIAQNDFKKGIAIEEMALKKYYENNTESFRVGEKVNVEYIGFEFADYEKDIQITDEEVTAYYEGHKDEFDQNKKFEELKDTLKNKLKQERAKEKALLAAEKIDYVLSDKTKSFEDAARENSFMIKETGLFGKEGFIPQIGWFPEFSKAAFKLNVGERSSLIKSKAGFAKGHYIIKVKEKRPSYIPPFEEVRANIKDILKDKEAMQAASKEAGRLHKKIEQTMNAKNLKFEEGASQAKRSARVSEPFARTGYVAGIGSADELGEDAFKLEVGKISPVVKTRAGYCIFTIKEITPIDEEKLKKEKEEFTKKTLEAKKTRIVSEWYQNLIQSADLKSNIPTE